MKPFKKWWQPLKRQRPRLTSIYFTLLISISFTLSYSNSRETIQPNHWCQVRMRIMTAAKCDPPLGLKIHWILIISLYHHPSFLWSQKKKSDVWIKYKRRNKRIFNNRSMTAIVQECREIRARHSPTFTDSKPLMLLYSGIRLTGSNHDRCSSEAAGASGKAAWVSQQPGLANIRHWGQIRGVWQGRPLIHHLGDYRNMTQRATKSL